MQLDKLFESFRRYEKSLPQDLVIKMSKSPYNAWTRRFAYRNPSAPEAMLRKGAKLKDAGIRMQVAMNRTTPKDVLKMLTTDSKRQVSDAAIYNLGDNNNV